MDEPEARPESLDKARVITAEHCSFQCMMMVSTTPNCI